MTALDPSARISASPAAGANRGWKRTVGAYVALTKPRIIELLLVTTVPVMFLAERGIPSLWLIVATLVGGSLSAGAANTFNCVYDRDIDAEMHRTSNRPMVTGEVTPRNGLIFGAVLTLVSTLWFAWQVNLISAALSLGAQGTIAHDRLPTAARFWQFWRFSPLSVQTVLSVWFRLTAAW